MFRDKTKTNGSKHQLSESDHEPEETGVGMGISPGTRMGSVINCRPPEFGNDFRLKYGRIFLI